MTHILATTLLNRSTSEVAGGLDGGRVESHDAGSTGEVGGLELGRRVIGLMGEGKGNSNEA